MKPFVVNSHIQECLSKIREIKEQIAELVKKEDKYKQQLYKEVGENEEIITDDGEILATWKYSADTQVFDTKEFKESSPEIYDLFLKTRPGARRLVIK